MDLASIGAFLQRLIGSGRGRSRARTPDPAEMGTAWGMEASLAPENWIESRPSRLDSSQPPA